jgi:hypothetical protein
MKTFSRVFRFALVATGATLIQTSGSAYAATFNFLGGTNGNATVKSFLDSGVTLNALNSNSTGNNPGTINSPGNPPLQGLCAFSVVGSGAGRCGYGTTAPTNGISAFQFTFDKPVAITSFDVSAFDGLSSGSIAFSLDNTIFNTVSISGTGPQALASLFTAAANQTVYVRTTGVTTSDQGGLIRLGSLTVTEQTPSPLPILGAVAAFRVSRRLRKQIATASNQA